MNDVITVANYLIYMSHNANSILLEAWDVTSDIQIGGFGVSRAESEHVLKSEERLRAGVSSWLQSLQIVPKAHIDRIIERIKKESDYA